MVSAGPVGQAWYRRGGPLLALGGAAFAVALAGYVLYIRVSPSGQWMDPVDLRVYTDGGLIVRHVAPFYRAHRAAPLYDWPGYLHLPFTYAPFAAIVFAALSVVSFTTLANISVGVNIALLLAIIWMTLGGLGCRRGLVRLHHRGHWADRTSFDGALSGSLLRTSRFPDHAADDRTRHRAAIGSQQPDLRPDRCCSYRIQHGQ